jgi:hypothetical protein
MIDRDPGFTPNPDDGNALPDFDMSHFMPPSAETIQSLNDQFERLKNLSTIEDKVHQGEDGKVYFYEKYVFRNESKDSVFSYIYQKPTSLFFDIAAAELDESGTPFTTHALYFTSPEIVVSYDKYYGEKSLALIIDKTADDYKPPAPSDDRLIKALTGAALHNDYALAGTAYDNEYIDMVPLRHEANKQGVDIPSEATLQTLIRLIDEQIE